MEGLASIPYQGTRHPELGDGLRQVTKDQAIHYFELDEAKKVIAVLAIFFSGQHHNRRILARLAMDQ